MEEYRDNGTALGWLIDPEQRRVYVYRSGAPAEAIERPETLSAAPTLPGFVLDFTDLW